MKASQIVFHVHRTTAKIWTGSKLYSILLLFPCKHSFFVMSKDFRPLRDQLLDKSQNNRVMSCKKKAVICLFSFSHIFCCQSSSYFTHILIPLSRLLSFQPVFPPPFFSPPKNPQNASPTLSNNKLWLQTFGLALVMVLQAYVEVLIVRESNLIRLRGWSGPRTLLSMFACLHFINTEPILRQIWISVPLQKKVSFVILWCVCVCVCVCVFIYLFL